MIVTNMMNNIACKHRNCECRKMNSQLQYGSDHGRAWDKMSENIVRREMAIQCEYVDDPVYQ